MDEHKGVGTPDDRPGVVEAPPVASPIGWRQPATQSAYRTAINVVAFVAVTFVVVTFVLLMLPVVH